MAEHQPAPDLPALQAVDLRLDLLDISFDRAKGVLVVSREIGQLAPEVRLQELLKAEVGSAPPSRTLSE
jgi:hypothetical protein